MSPSSSRDGRRARCSEAGDTLIEVLIAIVIIALTVTALLGALVTALTSSTTEQSLSTVDSVLNAFAQSAQYELQLPNVFTNCTTAPYRLVGAPSPASGPAGSSATVFVTGFAASKSLAVSLTPVAGGSSTPATITHGSSTDPSGDAAVTFTVPNGLTGSQTVAVSDGTSPPTPTPTTTFTVGGTSKGTTPVGYSISVNNPVQQWDAQATGWVNANSPTCPKSGSQQITVVARAPDGSAGSLSFVALGPATTTVLVAATSSSNPSTLGDTLTFTSTVVPPNSTTAAPTGSIQWTFTQSPGSPSCPNSALSVIVGTNTSQATCTVSAAQVGTYAVAASYPASGTSGNYGPGSGTGSITVGKAASSTVVSSGSSPSPAQPGSTLTFTATIGANPAVASDPKPVSTVVWSVTAPSGPNPTCAPSQMTNPTNGTGTNSATCSVSNAVAGTYSVTASYGGDGNYTNSQGSTTIAVTKATPTLSFVTTPSNPQPGSTFQVKVTVNGTPGIAPTGTVTWTVTPPSGTAPTCAPSTLSGGSATCSVANALNGTYSVNAAYSGDTSYVPASGSTSVVVTLAPAGADIQTVGNPQDSKPDSGDQIVFTYNQAMKVSSIQNGWSGSSENVTAEFTRQGGGQTQLAILCNGFRCATINLGTVALGDASGPHYVNGFGNTVDLNATMAASTNAAGQTVVTVTLTQSSGSLSTVSGNTALTWTPSTSATNPAGVACAGTPVTESGSPKRNF